MHQVQVEVIEPRLTSHAGGAHGLVTVVDATQGSELFLLETLDANRQAIDAQCAVGDELLLFEGPRIGFQGDLDVAGERNALLDTLEQAT
ncbi:hypothetical protein D3C76_1659790 [compost metagenome]